MKTKLVSLMCIAALLAAVLCGCGATAPTEQSMNTGATADKFTGGVEPMAKPEADFGYVDGMTTQSSTALEDTALTSQVNMAEKIIYTANVQMETMEFDATITALDKAIASIGGFVENSDISGDSSYSSDGSVQIRNRRAFYSIRVPASQLDAFLQQTGGMGNVIGSGKSAQNVTSQYTDNEARMASLRTQETRLLELMEQAGDIDALITLESKLAEVRYEIESIQRTLNDLDSRIAYSTVDLSIYEVELYQPTPTAKRTLGQRMGDSFKSGWRQFVRGFENFLVSITGAVFPLLFTAVILVAAVLVLRRVVKKCRSKKAKKEELQGE